MKYWDNSSKDFFDVNGYVIIENVLSSSECDYIRNIVVQLAKWEKDNNTAHIYDKDPSYLINEDLIDVNNDSYLQRVWNLLNKHQIFQEIIQLPIILEIMESIFDRKTKHQKYLLSSFQANILLPGCKRQKLHMDTPVPEPLPKWPMKANSIWVIDDFNRSISWYT